MNREQQQLRIEDITQRLFEFMPGAPHVKTVDGFKMWGDVEHTRHYEFCNLIATLIVKNTANK